MMNFNKNKIKMIKPFISFRDNLSSASWSNHSLLLLFFKFFPSPPKETNRKGCLGLDF